MLAGDTDPIFAANTATDGSVEEMGESAAAGEGFGVVVERLDFDKLRAAVFDGVIVGLAVGFLDEHFVSFERRDLDRDGLTGGIVHDLQAGGRAESESGGCASGDERGFAMKAGGEVFTGFRLQVEKADGVLGGECDGGLDGRGHDGGREGGVGASGVDDFLDAESFVVVDGLEERMLTGVASGCLEGYNREKACTAIEEIASGGARGHGGFILGWRGCAGVFFVV